jgi:hypothetical protein
MYMTAYFLRAPGLHALSIPRLLLMRCLCRGYTWRSLTKISRRVDIYKKYRGPWLGAALRISVRHFESIVIRTSSDITFGARLRSVGKTAGAEPRRTRNLKVPWHNDLHQLEWSPLNLGLVICPIVATNLTS